MNEEHARGDTVETKKKSKREETAMAITMLGMTIDVGRKS